MRFTTILRQITYVGALSLTIGCGSVPSVSDAPDVPASAWLRPALRAASVPDATIVVRRSTVFTQSLCTVRIYIDGQGAVDLAQGERALLRVDPGSHIIGADMPSVICPARMREVSAQVVAGQVAHFVIDVSPVDGGFIFQQTAR